MFLAIVVHKIPVLFGYAVFLVNEECSNWKIAAYVLVRRLASLDDISHESSDFGDILCGYDLIPERSLGSKQGPFIRGSSGGFSWNISVRSDHAHAS